MIFSPILQRIPIQIPYLGSDFSDDKYDFSYD